MASRTHALNRSEADLWIAITVLSQLFTPTMDQRLRSVDLTLFDFGSLMSLADAPDNALRISEMAERTYSSLPRMSKVVARLEQRDLVRRARCPNDNRATTIELTAAGHKKLAEARKIQVTAAREIVLDRLSTDEIDTVAPILRRLVSSLDPGGPLG